MSKPDSTSSAPTTSTSTKPPKEEVVLSAQGLTRLFGNFVAVDEVDFSVAENDFHSIIGPNGAGKTTFFDLLTGRLPPSAGEIVYEGEKITSYSEERRASMGISRTFQITQLFNDLTVIENLRMATQSQYQKLNPMASRANEIAEKSYDLLEQINLDGEPETTAKTLSHGEKKRLEIGMSLATEPALLLLDEPTSGLSGKDSEEIMQLIDQLTDDVTILLIEHDIDIVLNYSDVVTVLHQGKLIAEGSPDEISDSEIVKEVYLGGYE